MSSGTRSSASSRPGPRNHLRRLLPLRLAWRRARGFFLRNRWPITILFAASFIVSLAVIRPHDADWLALLQGRESTMSYQIARGLEFWGDFAQFNLMLTGAAWAAAALWKSAFLKRLAACLFLSATLAGLSAQALKRTFGRPRPNANLVDEFRGPRLGNKYHSFPSGHTSASFGSATVLLIVCPPVGIPAMVFAGAVGWSRINQRKHYPADVFMGAVLGIVAGAGFGVPLRRAARRGGRGRIPGKT